MRTGEVGTDISAQIDGDVLVAMIQTKGEQYFIERADKYPSLKNASFSSIIYKASDMVMVSAGGGIDIAFCTEPWLAQLGQARRASLLDALVARTAWRWLP